MINHMPGFVADASLYRTKGRYWLATTPFRTSAGGRVVSQLAVAVSPRPNPCWDSCKCCIHTRAQSCCDYCDMCLDQPIPGSTRTFALA